jgi:hypothetical protein
MVPDHGKITTCSFSIGISDRDAQMCGIKFRKGQCCESGIRCLLTPGSELGKNQDPGSGSGMNNPDHISESLETIFWVKIHKLFDADQGSGKEKFVSCKEKIRNTGKGDENLRTVYKTPFS